jgi:hypothetical protein
VLDALQGLNYLHYHNLNRLLSFPDQAQTLVGLSPKAKPRRWRACKGYSVHSFLWKEALSVEFLPLEEVSMDYHHGSIQGFYRETVRVLNCQMALRRERGYGIKSKQIR